MWPPEYTVKKSKRAKNVSLKVTPIRGLEIVVPFYYRRTLNIEKLINDNKAWISKNFDTINKAKIPVAIPEELNLKSINETWKVKYFPSASASYCTAIDTLNTIIVNCKLSSSANNNQGIYNTNVINDEYHENIQVLLKKWLTKKAKACFLPWLIRLSNESNLTFKNLNIRGQKTIWGSCDNKHTINLNCKLLFLPPPLVEHIMFHELAHTKHMNHGKRFKALLRRLDPLYDVNKVYLRAADNYIPMLIQRI